MIENVFVKILIFFQTIIIATFEKQSASVNRSRIVLLDHKGPVDTGVVRVLKIIEKYNYCYIYTHWPTLAICIFTHIAWLTIKLTVESYDFNTLHREAGTGGGREVTAMNFPFHW